jgi:uncharacterized protein (DUF2225 family)
MSKPTQIILHCPCCDHVFESFEIEPMRNVMHQTTDFYLQSDGIQRISYMIHTCTECGYTGYKHDFDEHSIDHGIKKLVFEHLHPLMGGKYTFSGNQYEYAAMIAKWKDEPSIKIGAYYLEAAWCYKTAKSKPGEKNCRIKAISYFEKAINNSEIDGEKKLFYTYLIGELYRRVDNITMSERWFDKVIGYATEDPASRWISELALQQKTNPRELIDPDIINPDIDIERLSFSVI